MPQNGLLIVFDGIDGVGKTTQLELVRDQLVKDGQPVETSRNLGGTPIGEALREVMLSGMERPETVNLYISVAIQEALIETTSRRRHDKIILMDRGPLSLAAYEMYGSDLDESLTWPHVENGMRGLAPDLTIIYEADVKTSVERARRRSDKADYFESKSLEYFEKVADGYRRCAERFPDKTIVIDANRSIEEVQADTMAAIARLL